MKKSMFFTGVSYVLAGCIFLICGIVLNTKINSLLWGFAGAAIGPGLVMICKYFYWSHPKNNSKYIEKIENEKIELHDERKEMLRNKTGRILFLINLVIISIVIVIFSVLGKLELIDFSEPIIITLTVFWVLQLVLFNLIFKALEKKS
ncbi:MAG: hypothetical protein PHV18_06535 [Lachnospiraceae bacterium]|nr:hypothetical protein [Lachnospiraceae bacterium]